MPEAVSVSVIIPCWRCADTIGRAVASVAAQTRPAFEVLLVDDASGNGTLEKLQAVDSRYPPGWIKIIALEHNIGPGGARNAGWEAARGEWIAFIDADDAWHPRKLEVHLAWLNDHPDAVLSGHRSVVLKEGQHLADVQGPGETRRITMSAMLIANRIPTRSAIVKRTLPYRFKPQGQSEDYLLWLTIIASGEPCYVFSAPLAISYRPHFSPGGYSGQLWAHERRELAALAALRNGGKLPFSGWILASAWSLIKYARRVLIAFFRRDHREAREPTA